MFIIIVFWLGSDRLSGLLSFVPALLFSTLTPLFLSSSSVPLSYFSLDVPMGECLGKHYCMSSPFPIAILNGTSFFLSLVKEKLNMPSGHYYRLCSWSGRSNHLIKLYFFYIMRNNTRLFINIVFWLCYDRPSGLLLFVPAVLFSILTPLFCVSSSVSSSRFIPAVPMCECLGKHSCRSSQFPIVILNGTSSFLSLVQGNIKMPSWHYYRLCSWSGR